MKHHITSQRQRGFTLVEIAIVLMIVGLLIGGILRGQELIQSARVRNIIDQKSAIQTAYIGFLDRYRMLPGDLNAAQAAIVGTAVPTTLAGGIGDGNITWGSEGILFFQNLTAAGFLSCGACMTTAANGAATVTNSPVNVYGDFVNVGHQNSTIAGNGDSWFDPATAAPGLTRLVVTTGGTVPSQVLAEVDRKADDGRPGAGQLRFSVSNGQTSDLPTCAPVPAGVGAVNTWANPSQSNCQASWLL